MDAFKENEKLLGTSHQALINRKRFLIVGLGGLGGYIANALVRLGVKALILVDPDVFDVSNLNRQLFSSRATVGRYKVDVIKEALLAIDESVSIVPYKQPIQAVLKTQAFDKIDAVFDAVDSISTKLDLERFATAKHIPLFHGALGGFSGQVAHVTPGSALLKTLYGNQKAGIENTLGSPTFGPPIIANLMVVEWVKWLHDMDHHLQDQLLVVDLLHHTYSVELDMRKR